ncbi:hypothetical protein OO012_01955 [Rhodobacteraceae bacterium KMM 6894]|nr:hypothetical protein [Rhodobacteraceae bacterium KMM 6894]
MSQDQKTEGCQTKCLLASAGAAVLVLIFMMALFGAAFLVALLVAVIVFFALAYVVPRQYCTENETSAPSSLASQPSVDTPVATSAVNPVAKPAAPVAQPVIKADAPAAKPAAVAEKAKEPAKAAKPVKPLVKALNVSDATGTQPTTLTAPRDGNADNLKLIKGVGPKLESLLHEMGFYHFDQIAGWSADEVTWVDQNLQGVNRGRASRDDWVAQATLLASGGETEFSKRASKGDVYK